MQTSLVRGMTPLNATTSTSQSLQSAGSNTMINSSQFNALLQNSTINNPIGGQVHQGITASFVQTPGIRQEEIRTIHVSGFPDNVYERELHLLCRFMPGYELSQATVKPGQSPSVMVMFTSTICAQQAIALLQGMPFDVQPQLGKEVSSKQPSLHNPSVNNFASLPASGSASVVITGDLASPNTAVPRVTSGVSSQSASIAMSQPSSSSSAAIVKASSNATFSALTGLMLPTSLNSQSSTVTGQTPPGSKPTSGSDAGRRVSSGATAAVDNASGNVESLTGLSESSQGGQQGLTRLEAFIKACAGLGSSGSQGNALASLAPATGGDAGQQPSSISISPAPTHPTSMSVPTAAGEVAVATEVEACRKSQAIVESDGDEQAGSATSSVVRSISDVTQQVPELQHYILKAEMAERNLLSKQRSLNSQAQASQTFYPNSGLSSIRSNVSTNLANVISGLAPSALSSSASTSSQHVVAALQAQQRQQQQQQQQSAALARFNSNPNNLLMLDTTGLNTLSLNSGELKSGEQQAQVMNSLQTQSQRPGSGADISVTSQAALLASIAAGTTSNVTRSDTMIPYNYAPTQQIGQQQQLQFSAIDLANGVQLEQMLQPGSNTSNAGQQIGAQLIISSGTSNPSSSSGHPIGFLPVTNHGDNPPCNTLFIGNLSEQVSELELYQLLSMQPGFRQMKLTRGTGQVSCFVEFDDITTADLVHTRLQGAVLASSDRGGIRIQFSKNPFGRRGQASEARRMALLASAAAAKQAAGGGNVLQPSYTVQGLQLANGTTIGNNVGISPPGSDVGNNWPSMLSSLQGVQGLQGSGITLNNLQGAGISVNSLPASLQGVAGLQNNLQGALQNMGQLPASLQGLNISSGTILM